jgi:hypothetical protein
VHAMKALGGEDLHRGSWEKKATGKILSPLPRIEPRSPGRSVRS